MAAKQAHLSRVDLLRGFDDLPNSALMPLSLGAAVRDVCESTEWVAAKVDPDYPPLLKLSARCTRIQVGKYREYLRVKAGDVVEAAAGAPTTEVATTVAKKASATTKAKRAAATAQ